MMALYRLLLRLYPRSFRNEYGDEMTAVVRAQFQARHGVVSRLVGGIGVVVDVILGAGAAHLDLLRWDLRLVSRQLRRMPGFTATTVLLIALGAGANTSVFSVTSYVLFEPLPFPEPGRIVKLWESLPGYSLMELSPANYRDWKARQTSFEEVGALTLSSANLVGQGEPVRVSGALVSAEVFDVLGLPPAMGRGFRPSDVQPGAAPTMVLSHGLWLSRFGGSPTVVGEIVRLDGAATEVIGVMPRSFVYPTRTAEYWAPLVLTEDSYVDRNDNYLQGVARLRPDVTVEAAIDDLDRITRQLEAEHPVTNENARATVFLVRNSLSSRARVMLIALAAAAICVLLIAAVNLVNLLLARATNRRREVAVRTALGAGRERLRRQLVTEAAVIAVAGGGLGLLLGAAMVPLLARLVPGAMPLTGAPSVDGRVLVLATFAMLVVAVIATLAPLAGLSRSGMTALREGQRAGSGARERLRGVLVGVTIASSVALLVGTGLLVRTFWTLRAQDPGFEASGVLTLRTALPMPEYAVTDERVRWFTDVLEEVRALPGVGDAAYISFLPMVMTGGIWPVGLDGEEPRREGGQVASLRFVTPGFFNTLRIPIHQGRDVATSDGFLQQPVAVVSESFARTFFPDEPAIGQRFRFGFAEREIVGIVGDISVRGPERPSEPQVYLPAGQVPDGGLTFYTPKDMVIRANGDPTTLLPQVRRIVQAADPAQPVSDPRLLSDVVATQTATRSVQLRVLGSFALVALLLAGIGIHGVLSFAVSQRAQEIGVRMALGATRSDVMRLVVRRTAVLLVAGLVPGLGLAYVGARQLEAALVGVTPADPVTFLAAIALCLGAATLGTLLPARRATRIQPSSALRAS